MILRTREEKFLYHGSVGRVLHYRNIKDYADPSLGTKHHNDSYNKIGEVPTLWKCGKGPMPGKHRRLCRCVVGYQASQ